MKNLDYFEYSLKNDDTIIDFSNPKGNLIISTIKGKDETLIQQANKKLLDLITTYKTLKHVCSKSDTTEQIILEIIKLIEETRLINYSAFCIYFQVLKYSYSAYKEQQDSMTEDEKIKLFSHIIDCYIENRHYIYSAYGYTDASLQIMSDVASSRRNGKTGIEKIENIIIPLGFKKAFKMDDLKKDKVYILPDKGGKSLFNDFIDRQNIDFIFRKERDNKNPDVMFLVNDKIFILEHKLTNGAGGSQNADINEIISFIGYKEINKKVSYISCLQGNFIKQLRNQSSPKNVVQLDNIKKNLKIHKNNFFVNGQGFKKLITDLIKK